MPAERDFSLDILRFIGLSCIILAHINPPAWLFQVRNFDVVLMVLVSGLLMGRSQPPAGWKEFGVYLKKRAMRLVVPTWIFLTLLFGILSVTHLEPVSRIAMLRTYLLLDGIGYVWIIRVFLLVAMISPVLLQMSRRIRNNDTYLVAAGALLVGEYILMALSQHLSSGLHYFSDQLIVVTLAYSFVFAVGLRLEALPRKDLREFILFMATVAFGHALYLRQLHGYWGPTQDFKYPPQLYYLEYGLAVSMALAAYRDWLAQVFDRPVFSRVIGFIGSQSLWIYLWHILMLYIATACLPHAFWALIFITVYGCATLLTWMQVTLVNLAASHLSRPRSKLLYALFTG